MFLLNDLNDDVAKQAPLADAVYLNLPDIGNTNRFFQVASVRTAISSTSSSKYETQSMAAETLGRTSRKSRSRPNRRNFAFDSSRKILKLMG